MNNITRTRLDDLVKSYEDNQIQMEALEKANEKARKDILKELSILGQTKYISADNINASIQDKDMIRYVNESKIVDVLKALKMDKFIKTVPNTTMLNKELRANTVLAESLKPYFNKQKITALTVKQIKK